jgi:DNA-binding NarL/FixJ family response regulator
MQVVIGEDEALLRDGLAYILRHGGFEVMAAVGDADQLLAMTRMIRPELVVTDIRMPPRKADDGLTAALHIQRELPGTAVMVLSQHVQRRYATELLSGGTGGVGYLLKQRVADAVTFCADLRRVVGGGTVLDPEVAAVMVGRARRHNSAVGALTERQREVLALMAEGRSNAAIGRRLRISEKAVVQHVSRIYDQLDLLPSNDDHRRVLAVVRYLEG